MQKTDTTNGGICHKFRYICGKAASCNALS